MPEPAANHDGRRDALTALSTIARGRCPRCGEGALFQGFLTVRDQCEVCGLDLKAEDSGDGPAAFLIFIVAVEAVFLALILENLFSPPFWVHAIVAVIVVIGSTISLLRPFKALLIALQYRHKSGQDVA